MLTERRIIALAIASAIVTANAYYIHPIIGPVADAFGVSDGLVGIVPAANQIALALGVLLLLPLGDRLNNRSMVIALLPLQVIALLAMATLAGFKGFVVAATCLGFFTVTPYLLPAYVSKRVDPNRLGFVTAVLTVGVVAGVQFARIGSGVIAEHYGWRSVYLVAAGLMALASLMLPLIMESDTRESGNKEHDDRPTAAPEPYLTLLASLPQLMRGNPEVVMSGVMQGLNFGIFLAAWMGIGLHLTSAELALGTDVVGYLSAFSLLTLFTTPRLGKWADRLGAQKARYRMAFIQIAGICAYSLVHVSWWWLLVPIVVTSIAGPMIDVTGRMTSLSKPPEIRTRLMTVYVMLMFVGGSLGSWSGTVAYELGGWNGTVIWTGMLSVVLCLMSRPKR